MSTDLVGYELRAEVNDFAGGSVSVADGQTIDLKDFLGASGKGYVAADSPAVAALDGCRALKRTTAPKSAKPSIEIEAPKSEQKDPATEPDAPPEVVENSANDEPAAPAKED